MRRLIIAGCIALWALFPATSQAAPEGDATIRTDSFTVQAGQTGDGQAFCPQGTRVVGGGVTSTGVTNEAVQVSGPLDQTGLTSFLNDGDVGRSWYANVVNGGPGPNTYVSTAICSVGSDATIRTAPFTLQQNRFGDGQAFCPSGSRVVGGGVTSTGATNTRVQASGPLDESGLTSNLNDGAVGRSWYANVQNLGPGDNTYVSTAICSPGSDATLRIDPFMIQAPGQPGDGQASCPPGTRVVGGGITSTGNTDTDVQVSGPLDQTGLTSNLVDGDVGRSWYANVYNNGGQNTYVATAICAPATPSTIAKQSCKGKAATIVARQGVLARTLTGTSKRDVIVGTSGRDKINAGKGNDLVCAGGGNDKVRGGGGKDKLFGQGGKDKLLGGGGNDTCVGGAGKDKEKSC